MILDKLLVDIGALCLLQSAKRHWPAVNNLPAPCLLDDLLGSVHCLSSSTVAMCQSMLEHSCPFLPPQIAEHSLTAQGDSPSSLLTRVVICPWRWEGLTRLQCQLAYCCSQRTPARYRVTQRGKRITHSWPMALHILYET